MRNGLTPVQETIDNEVLLKIYEQKRGVLLPLDKPFQKMHRVQLENNRC